MNDTYQPSPDDVEAASSRFSGGDDLAEGIASALRALHARGWRDAADVTRLTVMQQEAARDRDAARAEVEAERRERRETYEQAKRIEADRDALAAKLAEAERITDGLSVAHVLAFIRERDAAIARAEAAEAEAARQEHFRAEAWSHAHQAEARAARLAEALAELVRLKGIKERLESWRLSPIDTEQERDDLWKHYECCKDLAWSDARQALAADTAEKETRE